MGLTNTLTDLKPYEGRGGKREGAGRPPKLANQLDKADKLAKKLNSALKVGMEPLIENYPKLMEMAVDLALGANGEKPNTSVLMKLLDIPLKLIPPEELQDETGQQRLLKKIVEKFSGDITLVNAEVAHVGSHPKESSGGTGTPPDTERGSTRPIPRTMDGSSRHVL